jgi:hypothetical protein
MNNSDQYQVETSNIIHETIDNEVVVVNLDKGYYYSLRDTAAEIWTWLLDGISDKSIVQKLSKRYRIEASQIKDSVNDFILEMVKENILSPVNSYDGSELKKDQEEKFQDDGKPGEYLTPVLEKFTDMADLLLLDPIHEVDESGWPNIAPEPPDEKP